MTMREQKSSAACALPGSTLAAVSSARTNAFGFMVCLDYSIGWIANSEWRPGSDSARMWANPIVIPASVWSGSCRGQCCHGVSKNQGLLAQLIALSTAARPFTCIAVPAAGFVLCPVDSGQENPSLESLMDSLGEPFQPVCVATKSDRPQENLQAIEWRTLTSGMACSPCKPVYERNEYDATPA